MDIKSLCLGALTLGEASGYDIRKRFEETFGHFMEIAPSAVYPALKDLNREGLVTFTKVEQESRPNKKVYRLTDTGFEAFQRALAESPGRHKVRSELLLLMFFAQLLPPRRLEAVLNGRLEELEHWVALTEQWLDSDEGKAGTPGQHLISEYALVLMRAEVKFLREKSNPLVAAFDEAAEEPAQTGAGQ